MASYKLHNFEGQLSSITVVKDNGEVWNFPIHPDNTDYQQYLEWTKASPMNVAEPADEVTE
jgi:hypothetical protein